MRFGSMVRVLLIFAAAAAFAQTAQPGTSPGTPVVNRGAARRKGPAVDRNSDPLGVSVMRERVDDMESTISQMRGVLEQMHANAAKSKVPSSMTKANLELWDLMVRSMDGDLQQLRDTLATREDMEARRIAMYKQADAKAAAAAQAGRAAQAARFAQAQKNANDAAAAAGSESATGQTAAQSPATQAAPTQPAVPATNNPASPN